MILEDTLFVRPGDSRPVGPAGHCTYCREPIGQRHKPECVIVTRTAVVRMTIEYVVSVPASHEASDVEFHRNDSSWCAGNALDELQRLHDAGDCLCSRAKFEYVRDATQEDHNVLPESVLDGMRAQK